MHVERTCQGSKKVEMGDNQLCQWTVTDLGSTDPQPVVYPWVTFDVLPDNVLLEIFNFYLAMSRPDLMCHLTCKLSSRIHGLRLVVGVPPTSIIRGVSGCPS